MTLLFLILKNEQNVIIFGSRMNVATKPRACTAVKRKNNKRNKIECITWYLAYLACAVIPCVWEAGIRGWFEALAAYTLRMVMT